MAFERKTKPIFGEVKVGQFYKSEIKILLIRLQNKREYWNQ